MTIKILIPVTFLFLINACQPATQIDKSWSAPDTTNAKEKLFHKILFVALLKNADTRKKVEDKLVAQSEGRGVASYSYLPMADTKTDQNVIGDKLKTDGFDGIAVLRLATADKNATYVPGNYPGYYGNWFGYYSNAAPGFSSPNYFTNDKSYYIETNIYSLKANTLIWTGVTSVVNTSNVDKMIDGLIKTVKDKMREQGVIK